MIDRAVAIKLFSPQLARGDGRARFLREARVVGQISHPCVVALHDMGIEESTLTPYLVMELIDGQSMEKALAKGSIPFPTACSWIAQIAVALSIAHRRGIIHGDVKPANILITNENRVKLSDFGMARLASHDTGDTSLLGTPAYWCPEQLQGRPQDARSDLFSLGAVLYEMVTGVSPFAGSTLQNVCNNVLSSTPLPASQSNPSLPAALDDIIAGCLAKDPQGRVASADALAEQLFPLARRKAPALQPVVQDSSLRNRAARLLRSA
jgi:serine/threonine-protein kinase